MLQFVSECFSIVFGVFPLPGRETKVFGELDPFETVFLASAFRLPLVLCLPRRGSSDVFAVGGNLSVWSIVDSASLEKNILRAHAFGLSDTIWISDPLFEYTYILIGFEF